MFLFCHSRYFAATHDEFTSLGGDDGFAELPFDDMVCFNTAAQVYVSAGGYA